MDYHLNRFFLATPFLFLVFLSAVKSNFSTLQKVQVTDQKVTPLQSKSNTPKSYSVTKYKVLPFIFTF